MTSREEWRERIIHFYPKRKFTPTILDRILRKMKGEILSPLLIIEDPQMNYWEISTPVEDIDRIGVELWWELVENTLRKEYPDWIVSKVYRNTITIYHIDIDYIILELKPPNS